MHPGIIPGWSLLLGNPWVLGRSVCATRGDSEIATVTRESLGTLTEQAGVCVHPRIMSLIHCNLALVFANTN